MAFLTLGLFLLASANLQSAVARWASAEGAKRVYLQVVSGNEAAVALYEGLGFRTHHTYVNRRPPASA